MDNDNREHLMWLAAGQGAATFVAVTQLATRSELNLTHKVAILFFSAALPALAVSLATLKAEIADDNGFAVILVSIGSLLFCGGVVWLFASFGIVYAVVCILAAIGSYCLALIAPGHLTKSRR